MHVNGPVTTPSADSPDPGPGAANGSGDPASGAGATAGTGHAGSPGRAHGLSGLVRTHRPFGIVLAAAVAVRLVVMAGYPPAMFFNDSYNYMTDAVTLTPDIVRPDGYPFFLLLLLPSHSLVLVTSLQALMGLGMGAGIYAVLRRRGLPWWGATLLALPVLFDVFELQLEHMIAADVLFYTLVTAVLVTLAWWDTPPLWAAAAVGLATGYAATVRAVGEPLLAVVIIGMLARRMGWRRVTATAVAGVLPVLGYMAWFHSITGRYALSEATGTFLYSRVQSFADCARMHPPASLRVLCDPRAIRDRPISQEYLWSNQTPLAKLTGTNNVNRFTPRIESLTIRFAELAIESQPLDYAKVVVKDTARAFLWTRANVDNATGNLEGSGSKFRFEPTVEPVPSFVTTSPVNAPAARDFGGASYGHPSVVQPWASMLWAYQKAVYLRGPFLLLLVGAGAAGVWLGIPRKTRIPSAGWGGLALLPWLTGVTLLVLPPMTAGFSYRYALAAVPAVCLAAGLAFAGRGSLATWFRTIRGNDSGSPARPL